VVLPWIFECYLRFFECYLGTTVTDTLAKKGEKHVPPWEATTGNVIHHVTDSNARRYWENRRFLELTLVFAQFSESANQGNTDGLT
jgi:hypothetical protein